MKMLIAALAATLAFSTAAPATDIHDEIVEWVFEPCMEVAAALDVKSMKEEDVKLGVKREHIAQLMLASRDNAIRDVVAKMKAGTTWNERRAAYPTILQLCLSKFTDE